MTDEPIDVEEVTEPGTDLELHSPSALASNALLKPAGTFDQIVSSFTEYQDLRNRLLTDDDFQTISKKKFPKKSAWRKMATAMALSTETLSEKYEYAMPGEYEGVASGAIIRARVRILASAPNGRHTDSQGLCYRWEKCCPQRTGGNCTNGSKYHTHCLESCNGDVHFSHIEHDIPSTAETRAKNRAISDLIGFGEVSAEEVADVPAEDAEITPLIDALNAIDNTPIAEGKPASQRSIAKAKFVERFGMPSTLTRDSLAPARAWIESVGGKFASDGTPTPAVATADAVVAPPAPQAAASAPQESPAATVPPDAVADIATGPTEPPAAPTVDEAPTDPGADATVGASEAPAAETAAEPPRPPVASPKEAASTPAQRQQIAIACKAMEIDSSDKQMMVLILTKGRTSTTTEMSHREATAALAALRHIKAGTLAFENVVLDDVMNRALVGKNKVGDDWIAPYNNTVEP